MNVLIEEGGVKVQLGIGPMKCQATPWKVPENNAICSGTDAGGLLGTGYEHLLLRWYKSFLMSCQSAKMLFTAMSLSYPVLSWTMFSLAGKPDFSLMLKTEHKTVSQRKIELSVLDFWVCLGLRGRGLLSLAPFDRYTACL